MKEKSCGCIVYKLENGEIKYLLLHQNNGTWSFPKGHVEGSEKEIETAIRETMEECNLSIELDSNFRYSIEYYIEYKNIMKEAVYFVGKAITSTIKIQQEEINEYKWLNYDDALNTLEFNNIKEGLKKANNYLVNSNYEI